MASPSQEPCGRGTAAAAQRVSVRAASGLVAAALVTITLSGCLLLGSEAPAPRSIPPPPPPRQPPPLPRSEAYEAFDLLRNDLLAGAPALRNVNCAFAFGIDVSASAQASQVLEFTAKLLSDVCYYFLAPGDKVALIPWDSRVRVDQVAVFDYEKSDDALSRLNATFENLENLVEPERRGSNLLDARGFCMEKALGLAQQTGGALAPVVLIFTDIRTPDMDLKGTEYSPQRLAELRRKFGGGAPLEFQVKPYQAKEQVQIVVHTLVGKLDQAQIASGLARDRTSEVRPVAPVRPPTPPPRRSDSAGWRVLLIILAIVALLALLALPFTWRHHVSIGDVRESVRAFGGKLIVQSGRGISPRGKVFLPVDRLEDRALASIEGRGPQLVAVARRGVRLNDGRTELTIPSGRPCTLRLAIDGVPGEHTLDLQAASFFATNTAAITGAVFALVILIVCTAA